MTSDTVNTYNWDSDGNMIKAVTLTATTNVTYDAMDRAVEFEVGSAYTQIVYGPGGGKLALMNGQSLTKAFVPLAGGAVAVYNASGLQYYRHGDWLGSSRLASTPSRGVYYDGAYAPYGENYAESGTKDRSFTGQDQDMVSSGSYPLYDFLMREYHPTWGRWISPDPAGLAAVDPTNPQTWNRYAYVGNNPMSFTDPLGLYTSGPCNQYYCPSYYLIEQMLSSASDCATTHNCQQPGQTPGSSGGGGGGGGAPDVSKTFTGTFPCTEGASSIIGDITNKFGRFANFAGPFGPLGLPAADANVTFTGGPVAPGSTLSISDTNAIPVPVSLAPATQDINTSVTVQSVSPTSFTFTTNPGHVLYPATITFSAQDVGNGQINFSISVNGNFASRFDHLLYDFGGSNLENRIWNNFIGNVKSACGGPGQHE